MLLSISIHLLPQCTRLLMAGKLTAVTVVVKYSDGSVFTHSASITSCLLSLHICLSFLKQHSTEHIYLNNEEDLNRLTHGTKDDFQYLKFQAERGDIESQVCELHEIF